MKTETLINIGIGAALIGLFICIGLLSYMRAEQQRPKEKPADTVRTQNPCTMCGVIETYSLNVNCYHYGDSINNNY